MLRSVGNDELHTLRKEALARYRAAGLPTTKHEEWKYTSLRHVAETSYAPAYGLNLYRDDIAGLPLGKLQTVVTLAFLNGQFAPELSTEASLPDGVFFGTIEQALENLADSITPYLAKLAGDYEGKLGSTNESAMVDLNTAFLSEGAVLFIPKGKVVETALHIQFISKPELGAFFSQPRVLIVAEEGSIAKVVESYIGFSGDYLTNSVTEVVVGKHANLEHTKVQIEGDGATHLSTLQVWQEGESVYTNNNFNFGGLLARNDLNVWINGEHAETWLNGSYTGLRKQHVDNHTRIDHAKPNCNSFEVYKGVLGDQSKGVFNGKIFVYEDAQKTDAKQTNQAILLSKEASVDTKPQLEIFADDVKCTHGATVGQLREDAMFYLRARGIPANQARAMLVYAFVAEVLEKITVDEVREQLEELLFSKLGQG